MTSTDEGHTHVLSPHMFTPTPWHTLLCHLATADYFGCGSSSRIFSPVCNFTWVCQVTCLVCVCSRVHLKHIVCEEHDLFVPLEGFTQTSLKDESLLFVII